MQNDQTPEAMFQVSERYYHERPMPLLLATPTEADVSALEACVLWCKGAVAFIIGFGIPIALAWYLCELMGHWGIIPCFFIVPCLGILLFEFLEKRLFPR